MYVSVVYLFLCTDICACISQQINDINQDVKVSATGTGEATVQVRDFFHLFLYVSFAFETRQI